MTQTILPTLRFIPIGIVVSLPAGIGSITEYSWNRPRSTASARATVVTSGANQIRARISNLRNSRGTLRCLLYNRAQGFPESTREVLDRKAVQPVNNQAECVFDNITPNQNYAIVIHHDENNDDVFQRGLFGRPLEGYGFSTDFRPVFSVPTFQDCSFRYTQGTHTLPITARY